MNLELSEDQSLMPETFARCLNEHSSMARMRAVLPSGFDYGPMGKLFSSEKFMEDSSDLLDLAAPDSLAKRSGPTGFLNQCYRHSQGTTIYGGTSEIHRSLIAERALQLPRARGAYPFPCKP